VIKVPGEPGKHERDGVTFVIEPGARVSRSVVRHFRGNNNWVQIGQESVVKGMELVLRGSENLIDVGPNVRVHGFRVDVKAECDFGHELMADRNTLIIGRGACLGNVTVSLFGSDNRADLGSGVHVQKRLELLFSGYAGTIRVGAATSFQSAVLGTGEFGSTLSIGMDSMFGDGFLAMTSDRHAVFEDSTNERLNPAADIEIGDHVWAGTEVWILKGVRIRPGCVIAARSVVTKTVVDAQGKPVEKAVLAGHPARAKRVGITWTREITFPQAGPDDRDPRAVDAFQRANIAAHHADEALSSEDLSSARDWLARAIRSYRVAVSYRPDYLYAHSGMGSALVKMGRIGRRLGMRGAALNCFLQASDVFDIALRLNPDHADSQRGMVQAREEVRATEDLDATGGANARPAA
jgi:acetyltransferase-like isoleucine patch superfamily enzyme